MFNIIIYSFYSQKPDDGTNLTRISTYEYARPRVFSPNSPTHLSHLTYSLDLTVSNWKRKYYKADDASSCCVTFNKPSKNVSFERLCKCFILKSYFRSKTEASVLQGTTRGWYWVCVQRRQFISTCTGLKLGEEESMSFLNVWSSARHGYDSAFQCLISLRFFHTSLSVCLMILSISCHHNLIFHFRLVHSVDSLLRNVLARRNIAVLYFNTSFCRQICHSR